ncbi:DUF3040 domain-containing protein [Pseudonocardia kujensis]|uniref:DUF3040 domain-containing protein n=1 Tax=Pseudonocardia kujensis TaxID=1128675 RepID=UPI001E2BBD2B|nr:DUF3040 domain-containing protein [Pseudonocardia kujensis]MCE0765999.1 DUF3040 domain-containing protein [Pseudonocardia kujensis]
MLSERELRVLREIEQHTAREDPRFATSMRRPLTAWQSQLAACYDALSVVAVLTAVLCLLLGLLGAGLTAALLAVGATVVRPRPSAASIRQWRSRDRPRQ